MEETYLIIDINATKLIDKPLIEAEQINFGIQKKEHVCMSIKLK